MTYKEVCALIGMGQNTTLNRYSRRVEAIYKAGSGSWQLSWTQKEWRYTTDDEDFVPEDLP